jgi:hypothetical protein
MLKRYGDKALEQSRTRVDELAADGDHDGADTWRSSGRRPQAHPILNADSLSSFIHYSRSE